MSVIFRYGLDKSTKFQCKKLVVAKANDVITGGEKYYTQLFKKLNTGIVAQQLENNTNSFEKTLGDFISKKQAILEKKLKFSRIEVDPQKRSEATQKIASSVPKDKSMQSLANIYKYFAEKTKPETYY